MSWSKEKPSRWGYYWLKLPCLAIVPVEFYSTYENGYQFGTNEPMKTEGCEWWSERITFTEDIARTQELEAKLNKAISDYETATLRVARLEELLRAVKELYFSKYLENPLARYYYNQIKEIK